MLDIVAPDDPAAGSQTFADVRAAIAQLEPREVRTTLLVLLDQAGGDLTRARQNVERWFDDAMDRLSGWYKRRAQAIILALAAAITLVINADTVMIVDALWRDRTLRDSVVATAVEAVKQAPPTDTGQTLAALQAVTREVQALPLPLGWSRSAEAPRDWWGWGLKAVGCVLTTLAVSLGAPFWFDLMGKLVNLRAAGGRPERTTPAS